MLTRMIGSRCQWLISRGYNAGLQCGNDGAKFIGEPHAVWLCVLHLGMYLSKQVCSREASDGGLLVSEHGRCKDRKGKCRVCGEEA